MRIHKPHSFVRLWVAITFSSLLCGCESQHRTHEDLDATLWAQTSAEYQAVCGQAYHVACAQMEIALEDPSWSADIVQRDYLSSLPSGLNPLPPAVIVDVDETILDNSPYQARQIQENRSYSVESWHRWVEEAQAEAVPGAKEFLDAAREAGVTVFFVTNRENAVEHATRRNLELLELCKPDGPDLILSKNERDDWTSDKATRRAYVAKRYRILLLVGDDLNDFVSVGYRPSPAMRRQLARKHAAMWGKQWIILPNASYGGWERSLYEWKDDSTGASKLQKKYGFLNDAVENDSEADD